MEDKQIIKSVVDTLTGKRLFQFTVHVKRVEPVIQPERSLYDRIRRKPAIVLPEPETQRYFEIWPSVVVNQYRIAGAAVQLPTDLFDDETKMLAYVPEHLPTMVYIIAAAIQNDYREPEQELITFLEHNLDNLDIVELLAASLQGTNMQSFTTSIVLMNGTATILKPKETSPQDGSE